MTTKGWIVRSKFYDNGNCHFSMYPASKRNGLDMVHKADHTIYEDWFATRQAASEFVEAAKRDNPNTWF